MTGTVRAPAVLTLAQTHPDGRVTRYRLMLPPRGERWPVVLFSHGANSSSALYDRLWRVWAARGFAVIGADHVDTGPAATQAKPPPEGLWASRVADTALPLRAPAAFDAAAHAHGGGLDWRTVAAAGHSFGAVVAQGLAGARLLDPATHGAARAAVPAVRACLAFSPPGPLAGFVPADAWAGVSVPSLLATGDADALPGFVDDWHSRLTGFAGAPARWLFVGHGVDHYFGGLICRLRDDAGAQGRALDEAAALSADFLAAYLRGEARALAALDARARIGDDGVAMVRAADAAPAARRDGTGKALLAGGLLAAAASARGLPRRHVIAAALALPLLPALAQAAEPAPPPRPPSRRSR